MFLSVQMQIEGLLGGGKITRYQSNTSMDVIFTLVGICNFVKHKLSSIGKIRMATQVFGQ